MLRPGCLFASLVHAERLRSLSLEERPRRQVFAACVNLAARRVWRNEGQQCRDSPQRAAPIERNTASLGQQSTLSPADFWYAPSAARVFIPALPSSLSL